jgi:hypothetical protein
LRRMMQFGAHPDPGGLAKRVGGHENMLRRMNDQLDGNSMRSAISGPKWIIPRGL